MSSTILQRFKSRSWQQRLRYVLYQVAPILYCMPLLLLIACGNSGTDVVSLAVPVDDADEVNVNESKLIDVLANDTPAGEVALDNIVVQPNISNGTAEIVGTKIRFQANGNPGRETFSYSVKDTNGIVSNTYGKVTITIKQASTGNVPVANKDGVFKILRRKQTVLNVLSNDKPNDASVSIAAIQANPFDNGQRGVFLVNNTIVYEPYGGTGVVNDEFTYTITNGIAVSQPATVNVQVVPSASATLVNNAADDVIFKLGGTEPVPVTAGSGNFAPFFAINSEGDTSVTVTYKGEDYRGSGPIEDGAFKTIIFDPTSDPKVRIQGRGGVD